MTRGILILLILLLPLGCGGYREGIVQKDEISYVKFVGNWKGTSVFIDDLDPVKLKRGSALKYGVSPGTHSVKVFRGEVLVLNRDIFLSDQDVREVRIP